jgi:formylglycine-generating enzyme required for sulfatase activity
VRAALALALIAACSPPAAHHAAGPAGAALSLAADAQMIVIPAGQYIAGSTPEEREQAYDDFLAASGSNAARAHGWFDVEEDRHPTELPAYRLDLMPVTNAAYAELVAAGGAPAPTMDQATWDAQGFQQRWPDEVERFAWIDGRPPAGREDHPVVLVTYAQAAAYCAWRGERAGAPRRLPTAAEMEKAARGTDAMAYPWGNGFDASRLNGRTGPGDTVAVGSIPGATSPFGVLDLAGNVYQWTSTPWPPGAGEDAARRTVKGSAWNGAGGMGRGASVDQRPRGARDVLVGFRCVADAPP